MESFCPALAFARTLVLGPGGLSAQQPPPPAKPMVLHAARMLDAVLEQVTFVMKDGIVLR